MALHIKSTKSFKILLGFSALMISGMAATFSITGIATLFSGYFLTVSLMMGALEFAKIVVASFLARYWSVVSKILRTYFTIALIVLILVTSGGIFGYLSDAYQKTKGDYTLVEKNIELIDTKIKLFTSEKDRYQNRLDALIKIKSGQEARLDSLYSRGQINVAKRVEAQITASDNEVVELTKKLNMVNDSISVYETKKVEKESVNITGELGPLKYIAGIFDTDMDTVVKYFIFLLIFVFDPLAVLLFVSLNTLIRKDYLENTDETVKEKEKNPTTVSDIVNNKIKPTIESKNTSNTNIKIEQSDEIQMKDVKIEKKVEPEEFVNELMNELEKSNNENVSEHKINEHEFYHDNEKINTEKKPNNITNKSANYHPNQTQ